METPRTTHRESMAPDFMATTLGVTPSAITATQAFDVCIF